MKKKQAPAWYIAATHYLTAGFIPGIVCGAVGAFLVHTFTADSPFLSQAIFVCLVPIAAYIGVHYSAGYLKKAYILTSSTTIVNLASVYYGTIQVAGVIALIYLGVSSAFPEGLILMMILAFAQALSGFLVFYAMSAACIKDDPIQAAFSNPNVPTALFPSNYTPAPGMEETLAKQVSTKASFVGPAPTVPPPPTPAAAPAADPLLVVPAYAPPPPIPEVVMAANAQAAAAPPPPPPDVPPRPQGAPAIPTQHAS